MTVILVYHSKQNLFILVYHSKHMETKERLKRVLIEWRERGLPKVKKRDINIDIFLESDHIVDIVGVRRSGKTYLMFLMIKELFKRGYNKRNVIYVNFEDRRLYPLTANMLDALLDEIYVSLSEENKVFLFLDEIQNVPGWEKWARNIYDYYKGRVKLFVSGSTSKILAPEASTLLTGRHLSIKLLPLSFREFLYFKGLKVSLEEARYSDFKRAKVVEYFNEYLQYGGLPEVVLAGSSELKMEILKAYYEDILYKDIVDRYGIREIHVLENFLKYLFLNIARYFSYKRVAKYFSSIGISTSTRTLLRYTSILEEIFLFFFVPIYSKKVRNQLKYPRKIYAVDTGLRNVIAASLEDKGKILENIVFLELKRRSLRNPALTINYWKDRRGREVDFIVREFDSVKELIQVTWSLTYENKERELKALIKCMDEFKVDKGTIITSDLKEKIVVGNKVVECVPAYEWLLGNFRKTPMLTEP
ncbi:MAG: hypothetical protein DRJ47_00730 [Thermoprotei archaeon]|nr:MAG: hypothetical protein DRJ47_00730 [Thermoprotei archaeon]